MFSFSWGEVEWKGGGVGGLYVREERPLERFPEVSFIEFSVL